MGIKHIAIIAVAIILASCNSGKQPVASVQHNSAKEAEVKIKNEKTQSVYKDYIVLKNALVQSDSVGARNASAKLSLSLKNISGCETTSKITDSISNDIGLVAQRDHFVLLSSELIPVIKQSSILSGNIFVEHCPMANDGKGAFWLSSEKEIKNPYYGNQMLDCGEVKEVIKAK